MTALGAFAHCDTNTSLSINQFIDRLTGCMRMRNNIVSGIIVGVTVPAILFVFGLIFDWWKKSPIPNGVIIMTAQECSKLGEGWSIYKDVAGRFPISSGTGNDGTEARSFSTEEKGGEYKHRLTIAEMPKHTHTYQGKSDTKPQSGSATQVWHDTKEVETSATGGDIPHNIMPPYLALNFCIKS